MLASSEFWSFEAAGLRQVSEFRSVKCKFRSWEVSRSREDLLKWRRAPDCSSYKHQWSSSKQAPTKKLTWFYFEVGAWDVWVSKSDWENLQIKSEIVAVETGTFVRLKAVYFWSCEFQSCESQEVMTFEVSVNKITPLWPKTHLHVKWVLSCRVVHLSLFLSLYPSLSMICFLPAAWVALSWAFWEVSWQFETLKIKTQILSLKSKIYGKHTSCHPNLEQYSLNQNI